jgi:hypothetical protein
MKSLASILVLLASVGTAKAAAAASQKVAVLPVSGVNIHPGYLEAARDLLKDHLIGTGRFSVVSVPGAAVDHEYTPQEAVDLGRPVQADLVVVTHIVHLNSTSRVRMTALRGDGTVAHTDSMVTSGGPDDLDPVLQRLAVAFATGKPVAKTGDIETVTQREADPYLKQTATRVFGLRLGGMVPLNRPASGDATTAAGLGVFWLYDAREFMAEIWVDFFRGASQDITAFDAGIGGYYPFSKRNITPYIGGGAAWSSFQQWDVSGSGMRLHAAAGMLIGRLWSVQFRAELGYFVNAFSTRTLTGSDHYSHGPMLTLGLGF